MRTVLRSILLTTLAVVALAIPATTAAQPAKKLFSYEQVFAAPPGPPGAAPAGILGQLPRITGWLDDGHYLETRQDPADKQTKTFKVSAADGTAVVYEDPQGARPAAGGPPAAPRAGGAAASAPGGRWTISTRDNDLWAYDTQTKQTRQLTANPGVERNARLSPDGTRVAYTRDGNLFVYDLESSLERQLTSDGGPLVYNGWSSWVYMEEILGRASNYAAFWWSPDSRRLAFMRFDDTPVPEFPIYHADGQHGELERQRYPKAGDPNPWVSIAVATVADGKIVWMDFEEKADHYIAWPFWTPDGASLTVQWMNRGQDTIRLYACDPATGKKALLHEEKQASWVEWFEDLTYLSDGRFILRSSVDGWEHLYLHRRDGSLERRLTSGAWRVTGLTKVDEDGGYVYFTGKPTKSWDLHLLRVKLDGTGLETLTKGDGVHRVQLSPKGTYFIDTVSTIATPAVMALYRTDGTLVRTLGNQRIPETDQWAWGKAEVFTIPSEDGKFQLPAYWVLPPGFKASDATRKYPVIFSIYGGPDAGQVNNAFPSLAAHYWAQRGVIFISVDHRGSGHFGKQGVALMHRQLGKWEMADLIAAARWLRAKPYVAGDRIGITGSSYGGYTTTMALTYGAEHFNFGQAGASVTSWELYDTVYTERYMDTPAENPEGYKNGSVLTWIGRYKGGLRMTHGTIDDNVHMQNTIQVVDWLTSNNKSFELMLYPDSRHGYQLTQRPHSTREMHDFWMRNLLGKR